MKLKSFAVVFILVSTSLNLFAQPKDYYSLPSGLSHNQGSILDDTLTTELKVEKKYWLPGVEIVGLNFGIWGYSKYLTSEGWSDINWETIKNNFQNRGLEQCGILFK